MERYFTWLIRLIIYVGLLFAAFSALSGRFKFAVERLVAHAKIGRFDKREVERERELLRVLNGRLEALAGAE